MFGVKLVWCINIMLIKTMITPNKETVMLLIFG